MERRIGSRAQVDLPVLAYVDGHRHDCRAVDISPSGMLVSRTRSLSVRTVSEMTALELHIAEARPIRVRARTVWSDGRFQAVRFVVMNDMDRLSIAEHLDRLARLRQPLH
jgi:hypothetical protein